MGVGEEGDACVCAAFYVFMVKLRHGYSSQNSYLNSWYFASFPTCTHVLILDMILEERTNARECQYFVYKEHD